MTDKQIKENSSRLFVLDDGSRIVEPISKAPFVFAVLLLFVVISWIVTDVNLYNFFTRFGNFFDILLRMTQPNIDYLGEVIDPLIDTIQMSLLGSFLGAIFSLPVAIISASNINKVKPLLWLARLLLSLLRTLPVLVYASMFAMLFYYGILPGVMAITVFTFAIMTKMLYERIETIDMGAFTAIEATGATKSKSFFTAVLPQIMGSFLSLSLYSFEINIRYAAILGYVGAGGIGLLLNDRMQWGEYGDVIVVLFVLFLTVITIETTSRYIRRRLG